MLRDTLAGHLEHDVLEMKLSKSLDFISVKIILLYFLRSFAFR
jgi:hypothetical protein